MKRIIGILHPCYILKRVYFKLENLQSTGSFKIRGVANQVKVQLEENAVLSLRESKLKWARKGIWSP